MSETPEFYTISFVQNIHLELSPMRYFNIAPLILLFVLGCPKKETVESTTMITPTIKGVQKSPIDPRSYDVFVLENGMTVLVISDPETDKAAVSLRVQVGSFGDPWDRQGLAHLLEHMLLMGTEKYPDVDEYRRYIEGHGGTANASTGKEYTSYFFSVDQKYLEPSLDRFSQFFIAPKLNADYIELERNAVNSEFSLNLENDSRRLWEVTRQVANPEHPFAKFSVGNLETLANRENSSIRDELKAFYDAEYYAEQMFLAVIGREDLTELRTLVEEQFSKVPRHGSSTALKEENRPSPFLSEHLGVQINIESLSDMRLLKLDFPFPSILPYFKDHSSNILFFLFGHEGEGSLFSLLKRKGWVTSLQMKDWGGADDYTMLTVEMELTEEGLANHQQVVESFFQYVRLVAQEKDLSRYFEEKKRISKLAFLYDEQSKPLRTVQVTSQMLMYYPPEHVLDYHSVYTAYNDELIRSYLSRFSPGNMRMIPVAQGLHTDQKEPFYDTAYSVQPLDGEWVERWMDSPIEPTLHLPDPNPYITTQTALTSGVSMETPVVIKDILGLQVWHFQDTSFNMPRANIRVNLYSPLVVEGVHSRMCQRLFALMLKEAIREFAYPIERAGMSVSIGSSSWTGLSLELGGYTEKQLELLTELSHRVRRFSIDPDRFAVEKSGLIDDWRGLKDAWPIKQGNGTAWDLLDPMSDNNYVGADALESVSIEEFQQFVDQWFEEISVQMLIHGNHSAEDANRLAEVIERVFVTEARPVDWPGRSVRKIPVGEWVQDIEITQQDSVLIVVYQGEDTTYRTQARYRLLGELIRTDFFNEIRTKQQIGYIVNAFYSQPDRVPGIRMIIQSTTAGPAVLQERVDEFLVRQKDKIVTMSDEEFQSLKQGLISKMEAKDVGLSDRTDRLLYEMGLGYTNFDYNVRLINELKPLNKEEMVALYEKLFLNEEHGRILVRGTGLAHTENAPIDPCFGKNCVLPQLTDSFTR